MRTRDGLFSLALAGVLVCAWAPAACAGDAAVGLRTARDARARLLECDSATVMLHVIESQGRSSPSPGERVTSGTTQILAVGHNGRAWVRRFADALVPEGWAWKLRWADAPAFERADGRLPWYVTVTTHAKDGRSWNWQVDLLDGLAMLDSGLGAAFDVAARADSLRAVFATGMVAHPDAERRLRQLREPDASIMPLPEHLRR